MFICTKNKLFKTMYTICTQCISTCQCEQVQRFKGSFWNAASCHPSFQSLPFTPHRHHVNYSSIIYKMYPGSKWTSALVHIPPPPPPTKIWPSQQHQPPVTELLESLSLSLTVQVSEHCLPSFPGAPAAKAGGPGDFIQFNCNWLIIHWMIYWSGAKLPSWSSCCVPHSCCSTSWSWFHTKSQAVYSTGCNTGTVESGCSRGCEDYWQKIRHSNAHGSCVQLYLLTDVKV